MHTPHKLTYLIHIIKSNPSELLRLLSIGLTTAKFRYVKRCVGKGTTVEPGTKIIHSANVRVGNDCLLKEATYIRAGTEGKMTIKDRVAINSFCRIYGHGSVEIGEDTQIGPATLITTTDHDYHDSLTTSYKPVVIGKGVWIGANVTVLPGVEIGDFAVIGAGAVVTKDIPPRSVAVGVPARVIRKLDEPSEASLHLESNWVGGDQTSHPQKAVKVSSGS
jgi:acetyltransferase-like isoleucine patch superfamily enzyme